MNNCLTALTAVLALLFFTSSPTLANTAGSVDKNEQSVENNAIVMGVYDAPPNIIRYEGGIKGVAPQYIQVVGMLSDLEMSLKPMPYSRLILNSTTEDVDVVNAFYHSELEKNSEILTRTGRVKAYLVTLNGVDLYAKPASEKVSVGYHSRIALDCCENGPSSF